MCAFGNERGGLSSRPPQPLPPVCGQRFRCERPVGPPMGRPSWACAAPGVLEDVLVLSTRLDAHPCRCSPADDRRPHEEPAGVPLARAQARTPRVDDRCGGARPARRSRRPCVKQRGATDPSVHETLLLSRSAAFTGHRRHVCTGARRGRPDPLQHRPLTPAERSSVSVRHCFGRLMARTIGNRACRAKCGKP